MTAGKVSRRDPAQMKAKEILAEIEECLRLLMSRIELGESEAAAKSS